MTKLSVVIPCYNCHDTLEEAVASLFRQEPEIPFDVTMVDDGSTDATYAIMEGLANRYPNVRLVQHETNVGGGAARNTGVASSDGDLIFCLDGDDILGPDFLRNMTRFWLKKRCDGVGMSTSIKFRGRNINDIAYVTRFEGPGRKVRFESFLEGPRCSLSVVFMMTRRAFEHVGGYPTEHGFDTQGMAFRFLCGGLNAYTCPETEYFHRVEFHESYYLREYARGRLNWNWFSIFDEHLYVFRDAVKDQILAGELFASPAIPEPPSLLGLVEGKRNIYAPNYRRLLKLGPSGAARHFAKSRDKYLQYWLGAYHASRGLYSRALDHFRNALAAGFNYRIIYYRMLLAALRLSGRSETAGQGLRKLLQYSQPYPDDSLPVRQRIMRRALSSGLTRAPAEMLNSAWLRVRDRFKGKNR
jgi:glycosyltransferase involved in cell wall biosynthesis